MTATVLRGDARSLPLPDGCVDLIVTSPPYYGLRSYTDGGAHYDGQVGSEATPQEWLSALLDCTREWVRVLKPSGSIFVNLGDKYGSAQAQNDGRPARSDSAAFWRRADPKRTGIPNKSLLGLPWRYALACTDQLGLILRRDIIWHKPNGLPESVTDRCRSAHEYVFHFTRQPRYYAAVDEIREGYAPETAARYRAGYKRNTRVEQGMMNGSARGLLDGDEPFDQNPLGKLPGSVWDIPSQPLAVPPELGVDHFAAFPMELPRRIILGWSPPGVCEGCGEGRRPVSVMTAGEFDSDSERQRLSAIQRERVSIGGGLMPMLGRRDVQRAITGYCCACPDTAAPTRPSLVVDPFGGTGTTALVADALGRHGISVDRSADYCRLARWRTTDPGERARAMQVPKPPPVPAGQVSLFDLDGGAS